MTYPQSDLLGKTHALNAFNNNSGVEYTSQFQNRTTHLKTRLITLFQLSYPR